MNVSSTPETLLPVEFVHDVLILPAVHDVLRHVN
jgi:hypothetical protein